MSKFIEADMSKVRTISISERTNKVAAPQFAGVYKKGMSFLSWWETLPQILKGQDLKGLVEYIISGYKRKKPVIWMLGAHFIKCGLSPILIDLIKKGIVDTVVLNGAGAIHDVETAYWGQTSEDVAENLKQGSFGMSRETASILNDSIKLEKNPDLGFGEILGKKITENNPEFSQFSILANAYNHHVPVTVHVGIGTDIVHQHANADGAAIGERSLRDFRILVQRITNLGDGGVVLNIGSSVILPEVFLKALNVARNLGASVENFFTANFDMIQHYRPNFNVVQRPISGTGKGFTFTGHHELMIPLLAAAIIESLD